MKNPDIKNTKSTAKNKTINKEIIADTVLQGEASVNATPPDLPEAKNKKDTSALKKKINKQTVDSADFDSSPKLLETADAITDTNVAQEESVNLELAQNSSGGVSDAGGSKATENPASQTNTAQVFSPWSIGIAGVVGIAAASSGGGGSSAAPAVTPSAQPAAARGEVIDGYLSGATVFVDENGNGVLDTGEVSAITNELGAFSLPGGRSGSLVAVGGTDTSTGLPFQGILRAPEGASVVTPLTTLIDLLIRSDSGLSVEDAQAKVLNALGIAGVEGSSINLLNFDPIETASGSSDLKAVALEVQKAGVLLVSLVQSVSTAVIDSLVDTDGADANMVFSKVFDLLVAELDKVDAGDTLPDAGMLADMISISVRDGFAELFGDIAFDANAFEILAATASDNIQRLETLLDTAQDIDQVADSQQEVLEPTDITIVNATVDGNNDVLVLFFNEKLDESNTATADQFEIRNGDQVVSVQSILTVNNQVTVKLAKALDPALKTTVSYADKSLGNDPSGLQAKDGSDVQSFTGFEAQKLSLNGNNFASFTPVSSLKLAGSEISAFDPVSKHVFVTSSAGLQIVKLNADASLSFVKTVSFAVEGINFGNDLNSVAVSNGIVAVALADPDKTQPGKVFFLNANGDMLGNVAVGALPDMLTFSADGKKLLVANEGEVNLPADIEAGKSNVNPEGSVSIVDLSNGVSNAVVSTASFSAFNDKAAELKQKGVRLFAGNPGFETTTVAQDLEPEYISISPDGKIAFVTLQENNAIAILDLQTGQFTDIVPLGLKNFDGLLADFSDRDGASNSTLTKLSNNSPVFGQYMPDAISSFVGTDGKTYYVIANEGDDRDDFINPDETIRVGSSGYDLDNSRFPNEAALKANSSLGRLTVSNIPGNRGDTDGDGDIDQILTYGARSFSILSEDGVVIFDSGSHIEQFVAAKGVFDERNPAGSGLFDDTRSDNKGPEPEGITIGKVGNKTLAFVGLERGGGGVMVYDVTDPRKVEFVQYMRRDGDVSPEGLTFIGAANSPNGQDLLLVTNEVSNTLSVLQNKAFTLQLLHFADAEAGLLASQTASRLAALVDRFEDQFANTITLAGGDNFLPGPFLAAGTDPSLIAVLNQVTGSTLAPTATVPIAAADIAIHNLIGVQASTIGNHEFDLGSRVLNDAIAPTATYKGALFPYLSANLDLSGDVDLRGRFVNTTSQAGLETAASLANKVAPSAVIEQNGEKIGLVGATTQLLNSISSPSGTTVVGSTVDNMDLLAAQLQPVIDDLRNQGVNKIVLMAHLQNLNNERLLATKLKGVDIILAAGSNTRLGDANDQAVEFPGHAANFADTYPVVIKDADGNNTLLVNTDNEFTYLGRLVVDFDTQGNIILDSLSKNTAINGAYASTDANVAAAYGSDIDQAYAAGSKGGNVKLITDAVQNVINAKDGNVFGFSNVYLEGERANVRSEETNLGNLTADANAYALELALGSKADATYIVSLKNGGGIRAQIGTLSAPKADGTVDKLPPDGGVSQLDVENSLRFNNQLMAFDTTAEGLKAILEHGVAAGTLQGRFPQLGGVAFSWDATNPDGSPIAAGSRVKDIALVGEGYRINLYDDGVKLANVPGKITVTTLSFLANGGDGYPMKANGENFRYITENPDGTLVLSTPVDEALNFTVAASVPNGATVLGEQKALELFLEEFHATPETAFNQADTPASLDTRIQNLDKRAEDVLNESPNPVLISVIQGEGDTSTFVDQVVTVRAQVTAWLPNQSTFYIQEEARDHDGNVNTSEGIAVVYTGASPVNEGSIGDIVEFSATVKESFGLTRLESISGFKVVQDGSLQDLQAYTQVKLPIADETTLERFEGMLVEVSSNTQGGKLVVSDTFTFARFGETTFYADSVPFQFSQINTPSVAGNQEYLDFLNRNSIQLDDGFTKQNPTLAELNSGTRILRDISNDGLDNGTSLGADAQGNVNFIRMGDSTPSLKGVLGFSFDSYELFATEAVKLTAEARPLSPDSAAINANGVADIRVASFNVLNYFTTLGTASFTNPDGVSHQGRGATNAVEFAQQQAKIVEAMLGTGAHVFGLNEIQNNGFGSNSAIVSLVNALNAKVGSERFAFVQPAKTGGDAIMVAIVYDKTVLTPYGVTATPDTLVYDAFAANNRLPVAQTFAYSTDSTKQFTVVVNHLKSKGGSGTGLDADQGDGQGQFNATRLEAAQQLSTWLAGNPTGATDGDYLLIGDLNSYAQEDPIKALEMSGFSKISADTDHSYVFDGLRGSLDHALAKGLGMEITGHDTWNINSDEQIALDYNDEFTPADLTALDRNDAFRSSDHDPVIIGLKLASEQGTPAMVTPAPVVPEPQPETPTTPPALPAVFISEIHYDNPGADVGEAIAVQGAAGTDLSGWKLVAYNGSNGQFYGPNNSNSQGITLSGVIDDESNGQGELGFNFAGLQNGAPDGIALVNASGQVVQFLSYEGVFMATNGPATGINSVDIGVAQSGTEPAGGSLKFNSFTGSWIVSANDNFGALNFINATMENPAQM